MSIDRKRAGQLLAAFPSRRILVVGDLMLDRYVMGTVHRISPEAPVPVVEVQQEKAVPGGSSNVAWNLVAMGGKASLAGMLGHDPAGRELAGLLRERGVVLGGAVEDTDHRTTVKMRILAERQQVVRVDWEDRFTFSPALLERFLAHLEVELASADGVVLADYGKGVVQQPVVDTVLRLAAVRGIPVSLDPKNFALTVAGISFATPNRKEAFGAAGLPEVRPGPDPLRDEPLLEAGRRLLERWKPKQLLVTLGGQGMLLMAEGRAPRHVPARAREVFDVSGAGDTVIAVCTLAMASGASFDEAAELANWAAGVVVGKLGTATCTPAELLAYMAGGTESAR